MFAPNRRNAKLRALFPPPPEVQAALDKLGEDDRETVYRWILRIRATAHGMRGVGGPGRVSLDRDRTALLQALDDLLRARPGLSVSAAAKSIATSPEGLAEQSASNTTETGLAEWLRKRRAFKNL